MLKNFRDKIALSGITVLMIGIALLMFTFLSAYGFLARGLSIQPSSDLVQTFGGALAPLIETCINVMYLGVMGWIGSLITTRGVAIIARSPQTPISVSPQQPMLEQEQQLQPKTKAERPRKEKPKEEMKPSEPELVVITPEEISQPQQKAQPPENRGN